MTTSWRIVEYPGRDGLLRLEADWRRLVLAMPDRAPHHAWEAHLAYFDHLREDDSEFTCLALTDGERIRAICPLEAGLVSILGRRTRVWGLPRDLHDMLRDVVCPPDDAQDHLLPCVVRHLRDASDRRSWLVLDRILQRSAAWRCLGALGRGGFCADVDGTSDVFDCARPFEELSGRLSRNFRGNLRKARNKLAALADLRFETAADPESCGRAFGTFLEVEASGWKGAAGSRSALLHKEGPVAFFRAMAQSLRDTARCEINTLSAEGRCIAVQFCVRAGTEYNILKIGYDERYARVAPGQMLLERTLERCCQDPEITRLSLVSDTAWHRDWRTEALPVYCVYVALRPWTGRLLVSLLRARFGYGRRVKCWMQRLGRRLRLVR